MGRGRIVSGGTDGLYLVELVKDAGVSATRLPAIASRLSTIDGELASLSSQYNTALATQAADRANLDAAIAAYKAGTGTRDDIVSATQALSEITTEVGILKSRMGYLNLEKVGLERERAGLQAAMTPEYKQAWCVDYEDALTGNVGTIEMDGESSHILIRPGGGEGKGALQHAGVGTPSGVFYNTAIFPAWQKWKPTYRVAWVKEVHPDDLCDIIVMPVHSRYQGLDVNQPGAGYERVSIGNPVAGFADFINRYPTDPLVTNTTDTTVANTPELLALLDSINREVNDGFTYKRDEQQWGKLDMWDYMSPGGSGDCEDFALTKHKKLRDAGVDIGALKIEVGRLPDGTGHAWLVVQTDAGDYILDNNFQSVMRPGQVPYTDRWRQTGQEFFVRGILQLSVPVEYMDGVNAAVFQDGDRVVVEYVGQNWNQPKVIGFASWPRAPFFLHMRRHSPLRMERFGLDGGRIADSALPLGNNTVQNNWWDDIVIGPKYAATPRCVYIVSARDPESGDPPSSSMRIWIECRDRRTNEQIFRRSLNLYSGTIPSMPVWLQGRGATEARMNLWGLGQIDASMGWTMDDTFLFAPFLAGTERFDVDWGLRRRVAVQGFIVYHHQTGYETGAWQGQSIDGVMSVPRPITTDGAMPIAADVDAGALYVSSRLWTNVKEGTRITRRSLADGSQTHSVWIPDSEPHLELDSCCQGGYLFYLLSNRLCRLNGTDLTGFQDTMIPVPQPWVSMGRVVPVAGGVMVLLNVCDYDMANWQTRLYSYDIDLNLVRTVTVEADNPYTTAVMA